jgi:hypothetical protein
MSENFDWVRARLGCSPEKVFHSLKLEVEDDVKSRNLAAATKREFHVVTHPGRFVVLMKGVDGASITFEQTELGIDVKNEKDSVFIRGTLTINNSKECRLKFNGQEYESWQFRKLALEELFFGGWLAA